MTITTNRGKTFDVNWAWANDDPDQLMIELKDTRPIEEIAHDFDGLTEIRRKSEEEGDDTYVGYNKLTGVTMNLKKGTTLLTLERSASDD